MLKTLIYILTLKKIPDITVGALQYEYQFKAKNK